MGRARATDFLRICDGCDATVLCADSELKSWGWKQHAGGSGDDVWSLLLCDTCEASSLPKQAA